jgi:hypothetical protein
MDFFEIFVHALRTILAKSACEFVLLNMTYKKLFIGESRTIFLSIGNLKSKTVWEQRSAVRDIYVCFLHNNNAVILFSPPLLLEITVI